MDDEMQEVTKVNLNVQWYEAKNGNDGDDY